MLQCKAQKTPGIQRAATAYLLDAEGVFQHLIPHEQHACPRPWANKFRKGSSGYSFGYLELFVSPGVGIFSAYSNGWGLGSRMVDVLPTEGPCFS